MNPSSRVTLLLRRMSRRKIAPAIGTLLLSVSAIGANASGSIHPIKHPKTCKEIKTVPDGMSDMSAASPDGKHTACIKEDREDRDQYTYTSVYLSHRGRVRAVGRYKDVTYSSKLVWAPDSRAFAWNFTYGGASSGWTTAAFDFRSGRLREIDHRVSLDFHRRLVKACKKWPDSADADDNSYLVKWMGNRSVLIAVETHPGGLDCRNPVPTEFYQVAVPSGRIIKYFQGAEREAVEKETDKNEFGTFARPERIGE